MKSKKDSLQKDFLQDIELIFRRACEDSKWSVALRAKELLCRYAQTTKDDEDDVTLWSDERLEKFLKSLKTRHRSGAVSRYKPPEKTKKSGDSESLELPP